MKGKIFEQQSVKHEKTMEKQKAKIERGVKRNCTEGISGEHQIYLMTKTL